MDSFLLIGQSNMAGRGFLGEVAPIENRNIRVLRNGRWSPMFPPINPDIPSAGISLAESFADLYAKENHTQVGLIPCAYGGTAIDEWKKGSLLYDNAVNNCKLAQRTSDIVGILWHQGEQDCLDDRWRTYEGKLIELICSLRADLNLHDVPFICGELGGFLAENETCGGMLRNYTKINEIIGAVAEKEKLVGVVSADGLASNPDLLHFNAASLREFGARYYHTFKELAQPL